MSTVQKILRFAKLVTGKDFKSPGALRQYLEEHPKADKSKHKVVETHRGLKKDQESSAKRDLASLNKSHPEVGAFLAKHLGGESGWRDDKNELKRHEEATDKLLKDTGSSRKDLEKFKSRLSPGDKAAISKAVKSLGGGAPKHMQTTTLTSQMDELSDLMAAKMMQERNSKLLRGPKKSPSTGKKAALRTILSALIELQ